MPLLIGLIATGLVILNDDAPGLSASGKILLKSIDVSFGYVMAINLLWRFVWAGNRYTRWRGNIGHNPLARIGVSLLLIIQLATGLVIAGTDLFWPPFGRLFAHWIAAPGVDPSAIYPGASDLIDKASYQAMRGFRGAFINAQLPCSGVLGACPVNALRLGVRLAKGSDGNRSGG